MLLSVSSRFSDQLSSLTRDLHATRDATLTHVTQESNRVISSQREEIFDLQSKLDFLYSQEHTRKAEAEAREDRIQRVKNRKRKPLRDCASLSELERSLHIVAGKRYTSEYAQSRDIVALLLLFFTGLRVSNLRLLTSNNLSSFLDANRTSFDVCLIKTGTRSEPLRIHLDPSCHALALKHEIHFRTLQAHKDGNDYVFTRENCQEPLERAWLTNRLNAILKVTGKEHRKKLSTHSFRIGQINSLIEVFGIEGAKRVIGHKSIATTSLYARGYTNSREMCRGMRKVEKLKNRKEFSRNSRSHIT